MTVAEPPAMPRGIVDTNVDTNVDTGELARSVSVGRSRRQPLGQGNDDSIPIYHANIYIREINDSIGSHWLGRRRYFKLVPVILRYFNSIPVVLALLVTAATVAREKVPNSSFADGCQWVLSIYVIAAATVTWLTLRVAAMRALLKRPAAWVFLSSVLVDFVLSEVYISAYATADFVQLTVSHVGAAIIVSLLALVDALPLRLVKPVARYACALCTLYGLYFYIIQYTDPQSLRKGTTWRWTTVDCRGEVHEVLSTISIRDRSNTVRTALAAGFCYRAWVYPSKCLIIREPVPLRYAVCMCVWSI